jgi:hypothetical protein
MRDVKRIDRILKLISKKWKEYPDVRFGQLLINLQIIPDDSKTWYAEDDELEKWLENGGKNEKNN